MGGGDYSVLNIVPLAPVAKAGFSKGGGGARKFRKFENNEDQNEKFPAKNQVLFPAQN